MKFVYSARGCPMKRTRAVQVLSGNCLEGTVLVRQINLGVTELYCVRWGD